MGTYYKMQITAGDKIASELIPVLDKYKDFFKHNVIRNDNKTIIYQAMNILRMKCTLLSEFTMGLSTQMRLSYD